MLFGYALGLDKWLMRVPMQFLLLDLGHVDLGFDARNNILRVYACLGEEVYLRRLQTSQDLFLGIWLLVD